jgi:hypothetical protein
MDEKTLEFDINVLRLVRKFLVHRNQELLREGFVPTIELVVEGLDEEIKTKQEQHVAATK